MSRDTTEATVLTVASDISGVSESVIASSGYLCDIMEYEVFTDIVNALESKLTIKYDSRRYEIESIKELVALTQEIVHVSAA